MGGRGSYSGRSTVKKSTAKALGYKVIDEFGSDISTTTKIKNIDGKIVAVDEFDSDITKRVKILKRR